MSHKGKRKDDVSRSLMIGLSFFAFSAVLPGKADAQNLNCPQPMIFGDIIPCTSPGAIIIHTDNTRQVTGCLAVGGGTFSRARCVVTQNFPFRPIQVSVTAPTFTISNGTAAMNVNAFNIITNSNGPAYTTTAPVINVPIGATLTVGTGQANGSYTGTFIVNAVFQ